MGDNWEEFLVRNHFEEPKQPPPEDKPTKRSRRWKTSKTETKTGKSIQEGSEEMISEKLAQIKKQLKRERIIRKSAREKGEGPSQPRRSHRLRGILKKKRLNKLES